MFWSKVFNIVIKDDSRAEFWVFIQNLLVFLKNFDFREVIFKISGSNFCENKKFCDLNVYDQKLLLLTHYLKLYLGEFSQA